MQKVYFQRPRLHVSISVQFIMLHIKPILFQPKIKHNNVSSMQYVDLLINVTLRYSITTANLLRD